jgi:DNA-binding transcriptional ArsR family regulator
MVQWSFLTNHARVLVCIANDPGARLRDIAAKLDITERSAFSIVTDLVEAGYVIKDKQGRRNRYRMQGDLPLPEAVGRERTIGEIVALLVDTQTAGSARLPNRSAASPKRPPTRDRRSVGS